MDWELEDWGFHAKAFGADLPLDESKRVYSDIELMRHGDKEKGPYRTETNALSCTDSESVLGSIQRISREY